jgi:mannose-6-phosphate isomerase-like protein (cupin superfamily)
VPELRWRARRTPEAADVIVHHVDSRGDVVDDRGAPVTGFDLVAGATVTDLGRTADMSVLLYALADGVADPQPVHEQDEVYVVLTGNATAVVGEERTDVRAGSVLIVPAHAAHHFDQTQGGFVAVAVFAPPLT